MKRREFLLKASSAAAVTLSGCGGSSTEANPPSSGNQAPPPPPTSPTPTPTPTPAPPSAPSFQGLSTLTLHPPQAGTLPYIATVYPNEGVVPANRTIVSASEPNLRCSVLSTWPDGSAQVCVVAGQYSFANTSPVSLGLQSGSPAGANLTASRIVAAGLNSISGDFGAVGSFSISTSELATPDKTWWTNPSVICCRFVRNIGSEMQALIDVHAFFPQNRVFVEVVIENARMSSSAPVRPTTKTYTNATISVNGNVIQTASSAGHEAFRAWYCSTWIGGDPGVAVTHDTASLWAHPILFRAARPASYNFATQAFAGGVSDGFGGVSQTYGSDAYTPWATGRHRTPGMGGGGDDPTIGAFTAWEARYIQSGDKHVRNAAIQNALCLLSFNINYRDSATGTVTDPDAVKTRFRYNATGNQSDNFPYTSTEPAWEIAHQPEVGVVAFLCRPSPCFIELAQKAAVWNCTYQLNSNIYYQTRSRAWGMRNLGHAIFLTPDAQGTLKAGLRSAFMRNVANITNYYKSAPGNPLSLIIDSASPSVAHFIDFGNAEGFQSPIWFHHFCATVFHRLAAAKILRGADQASFDALADWSCLQPVRYVTEQPNGGWRFHRYQTTIGTNNYGFAVNGTPVAQLSDWGSMTAWWMTDTPSSVSGPWKVNGDGHQSADRSFASSTFVTQSTGTNGLNYVEHFWLAFCAAVERGVPGADAAWSTVQSNLTGLSSWLDGFATDARQGAYPRNR